MKKPELELAVDLIAASKALKETFLVLKDEVSNLFEFGLDHYLQTQMLKYWEVNTFLHQERKVNFYKAYFPISLSDQDQKRRYFSISQRHGSKRHI